MNRDMTQQEVADRAGIKNSVLSRAETGKSVPTQATIAKIAFALGLSESELEQMAGSPPAKEAFLKVGLADTPHLAPIHQLQWENSYRGRVRFTVSSATKRDTESFIWLPSGAEAFSVSAPPGEPLDTDSLLQALIFKRLDCIIVPATASDSLQNLSIRVARVGDFQGTAKVTLFLPPGREFRGTSVAELLNQTPEPGAGMIPVGCSILTPAAAEVVQWSRTNSGARMRRVLFRHWSELILALKKDKYPMFLFVGDELGKASCQRITQETGFQGQYLRNDLTADPACPPLKLRFQYDLYASLDVSPSNIATLRLFLNFLTQLAPVLSAFNSILPSEADLAPFAGRFDFTAEELKNCLSRLSPEYQLLLYPSVLALFPFRA